MSNWLNLKAAIQSAVKANGNREITGQGLQNALLNIVNSLGQNATFAGVATPTTAPGTPEGPVFYLASTPGEYVGFEKAVVGNNEIVVFSWEDNKWLKSVLFSITVSADENATFAGVATPDTMPETPEKSVFYLASTPGTYSGFGDALVTIGELAAFTWEDNTWVSTTVLKVENFVKVTYEELKTLRDEAKLVAGTFYRITDYVTTTATSDTKSANHLFDIIVQALSKDTLSEDANAILHEGDTYFADSDLSAWALKYCLDNDKARFDWANKVNGKGVIFRMIDEKLNDCPYDFKNILFYNTKFTNYPTLDKYYYTFSYVVDGVLYDGTTEKRVSYNNCCDNRIESFRSLGKGMCLNNIVFKNHTFNSSCYNNTFGFNCYDNTFDAGCYKNTFDNNCYDNTFGSSCQHNTFGNNCYSNSFDNNCHHNTFDSNCYSNTFDSNCYSNSFGSYFSVKVIPYGTHNNSLASVEEYYDDGTGSVVPVKHPDLSTQPSILPYKFMGRYVYEKLLYLGKKKDNPKNIRVSSSEISNSCLILQANIIVHEEVNINEGTPGAVVGCISSVIPVTASIDTASRQTADVIAFIYELPESAGETSFSDNADIYARIVYTSMLVEGGYYY